MYLRTVSLGLAPDRRPVTTTFGEAGLSYARYLLAILFLVAMPWADANAQGCRGNDGKTTINNCPAAVSPQSTDALAGWQYGSASTRRFTLQQVVDTVLGTPPNLPSLTVTGTGTFGTASAGSVIINGPAATNRTLQFQTAGSTRWQFDANSSAEAGSDAGSDLDLIPFSDAGANKGALVRATRATGVITINPTNSFASAGLVVNAPVTISPSSGGKFALYGGAIKDLPAGAYALADSPFLYNTHLTSSGGAVLPSNEVQSFGIFVSADTVQVDPAAIADVVSDINVQHAFGGGNTAGSRIGTDISVKQTGDYGVGAVGSRGIIAIRATTTLQADGAGGGQGGGYWTFNGVNHATSTAAHYTMVGIEQDMIAAGPNQPFGRFGMAVNSSFGDAVTGITADIAYDSASGGPVPGHGFLCVYCMGKPGAQIPTLPASTIIGYIPWHGQDTLSAFVTSPGRQVNQAQATNGVEFSRILFNGSGNGAGTAFGAPGFRVTDQGAVYHYSGMVQGTASGLTIDTPLYALNGAVTPASTTGAVFDGDIAWDETCAVRGIYQLTVVSSSVTAVTVLRPPACASNPGTLVLKSQSGGVTISTAWTAPSAQTITLGASDGSVALSSASGKLGFHGATPVVKATPSGACAGNTGCQVLRDAMATVGLINGGSISN